MKGVEACQVACTDQQLPVPPRSFVECVYNAVCFTDEPQAGHFAAFQRPGPIRTDLQEFQRSLRER